MIKEQHLYTTLITWLNELVDDFDFFIAYQNNELPKKYGTIYNITDTSKREYRKYFDKQKPKEKRSIHRVFLIQVDLNSTEDNLLDIANKIKKNIKTDKSKFYFATKKVLITSTSNVRNLPERIKNEFKYRRVFDVTVEFMDADEFEVDYITTADVHKAQKMG